MTTIETTAFSVEHQVGPNGSVSIHGIDGAIELRASDGPTVRLRGTGRRPLEDDYRVVRDAGELRVEAIGLDGIGLRWFRMDRTQGLELEVPHDAVVRVATASGAIRAHGLHGEQRYRTVSGDIRLTGAGGHLVLDGVSGDVEIRADARIDLEARVVSADIEASAPVFGIVRVKTTSGDLRLLGSLLDGGDHQVETISGDIAIAATGPIVVEGRTVSGDLRTGLPHRSAGGPGRRTLHVGEGGPRIGFRSISGGLTVLGPRPSAERPAATSAASATPAAPVAAEPAEASPRDAARLAVLRELEAGRIDVTEAGQRLAGLDAPADPMPSPEHGPLAAATEPIPSQTKEGTPNDD